MLLKSHLGSPWRGGLACSCSSACGGRGWRGADGGGAAVAAARVEPGGCAGARRDGVAAEGDGVGGGGGTPDPSLASPHLLALSLK